MPAGSRARKPGSSRPGALGRIEKLVLENFKSYEGEHEIGPFDKFTCIIGPNGSGKSNIMDAISFCLGIRAKHLRGDRLRDLVYRREEEDSAANTRSAKVTLVFRTAQGGVLHFCRSINARGEGAYRCGTPDRMRNLGYDEFLRQLADQDIFVKARNFLVFQGDVMELARRQGTDLTGVLETISSSDQMKEQYDKLSRELELTQEKARMHFQHRREMEGTVALLEQQRGEVERYQTLREQRGRLSVEMALFRLFCADREIARHRQVGCELREELARGDANFKVKRREVDEADAERKAVETDAEKATSHHFVLSSNLEQLKPEISNCRKQTLHWSKKLQERLDQIREEEARHRRLEAGTEQTREQRAVAEGEIEKLKSRQVAVEVQMTAEQRAEYEHAVTTTNALNVRTRERQREADEQTGLIGREIESIKQDLRDLEEKRQRSTAKLEELTQGRASLELEIDSEAALLEQRRKATAAAAEDVKKFTLFRDSLIDEQRCLRLKLDAAQARRERLDQVEARQQIGDELRSAFLDGVVGRISELVLPTQKRFDFPLQMSMGKMAEAFIVKDAATGHACVRYLKAKKISTETFLPLDRMVLPHVGPLHLLTQGHTARRLATMCVKHNEKFLERHPHWQTEGPGFIDQAVNFLLNGTVIVDDLEEAKTTAYRDARKSGVMPRVVTLDGEVIAPNGNMSVQSVSLLGRVEFGGAEQLHEIKSQEAKLVQVEKDLATLRDESSRKRQREEELQEQSKELEEKHEAREQRLRTFDSTRAAEEKMLASWVARIEQLTARLQAQSSKAGKLEQTRDSLESELLKVGNKHFAKLNQELGVEDVRAILRKEQREKRELRLQIEKHEDKLRQLLNEEQNMERRLKDSAKLEGMKRDCEQYERDIEAAKTRLGELGEREKMFADRCEAGRAQLRELSRKKEQLEQAVKGRRLELQRLKAQTDEARKKATKHNDKVRAVLSDWCRVFRECSERQVDVPLLSKSEAAVEQVLSRTQDLDDLPFPDLESTCKAIRVDFSHLPEARKESAQQAGADPKLIGAEYEAQIAELTRQLEGLNPNMRAPGECEAEEEKLKGVRNQADEASLESQRLSREFESVKGERIARFMKCFKHVEARVHPFYKELTSYDGFEGGSAYLDLDDAEEPYNGGITFTACPPGKRFFPMELLSGGERSMASMALLFAMHSYHPPPFMILDEVDAPFDRKNTNALVNYLKKLSFQCLVISLKDTFFAHSDSIVGIYKDKDIQSSGSVSLPLQRLGDQSEAPETEVPLAEEDGDSGEDVD